MSNFTKVFLALVGLGALFGFVLPYLISAKSFELTTLGILIILALGYTAGRVFYKTVTGDSK